MTDRLGTEIERLYRERDLYRSLLDLGGQEKLEPFLEDALHLVVETTGAERGYLELRDEAEDDQAAWSIAHSLSESEVEEIRAQISQGIISEALATGETVITNSALFDSRFSERTSVQASRIGAVVCTPIGGRAGLGVVYLQMAENGGLFSDEDRECAEIFAKHLAPLADRLVARLRVANADDPTRPLREIHQLGGIAGRSDTLAEVLRQAMLAAPLDVNVLLTGDSGTGKSQLAGAIHRNSSRAGGPFVELNCAALPEGLIESELFGAVAGAHSAANSELQGKVAAAEGGTLLLDEIGELPMGSQAKLLQLLQSREYYPLGSSKVRRADIRVIAATNADLEDLVRKKRFREDLFFRLHVLAICLPTLSERRVDIRELAEAACARVTDENRLPRLSLSLDAIRAIEAAEWPGNVRQLESAITAAAIRAAGEGVEEVAVRHVFPERHESKNPQENAPDFSFQEATRRFQRDLLEKVLSETEWNVSEAARRLDLARSHVYKLIDGFGFKRSREDGDDAKTS